MKEAEFYEKLEGGRVQCKLCAHGCIINPGRRGQCGVRENQEGRLISLVYGRVIAENIDPIEKKPLFHFFPGTRSYSIATVGCNFRCLFCQNADISQYPHLHKTIPGTYVEPELIAENAHTQGCATIAYTYTEPTIFMEYARDVAKKAHSLGIRNVFVSNGYMSKEGFASIQPYLDAANIDLKAFRDEFYKQQCGAKLKPVLETLERLKKSGVWLEITTLIIPGLNDDPGELRELAAFILSLGPETPWHVSRFHPTYRLTDRPITPTSTLRKAREIGIKVGLHYVYTGNIPGDKGENTYCHRCGELLIERFGFAIKRVAIKNGSCKRCGTPVAGVGF